MQYIQGRIEVRYCNDFGVQNLRCALNGLLVDATLGRSSISSMVALCLGVHKVLVSLNVLTLTYMIHLK